MILSLYTASEPLEEDTFQEEGGIQKTPHQALIIDDLESFQRERDCDGLLVLLHCQHDCLQLRHGHRAHLVPPRVRDILQTDQLPLEGHARAQEATRVGPGRGRSGGDC